MFVVSCLLSRSARSQSCCLMMMALASSLPKRISQLSVSCDCHLWPQWLQFTKRLNALEGGSFHRLNTNNLLCRGIKDVLHISLCFLSCKLNDDCIVMTHNIYCFKSVRNLAGQCNTELSVSDLSTS